MNNENKPSVIAELAAALASMAERAAAAEAEAEQYKKSSGEWYQFFTSKDKELRDTQAELDRITSLADSQIEKIQQRVEAAQRRYENGTRFLTGKLAEYFETVPHKTTKTKHSYRLLSGTLVKKIGGRTMKQDDDALLAYLKASDNEDMIQTTEKPKWGEFKKRLEIVGGQIVDKTTGELVEGVQIIEKPDTFTVDV